MNQVVIPVTCLMCQDSYEITMQQADYGRWQGGEHIQIVAPYLSEDERELLISGICGKCFDKLFAEEVEEE